MKYTLDAENKSVGRIATQAAVFLMGKYRSDFAKNKIPNISVSITNASKAKIFGAKLLQKTYSRYSGYPGGLKQPTMKKVIEDKGYSEVFREAVSGMLPKNKLRAQMMKNLTVTE
jgi:large subunit ribosomal protein L13